MVFMLTRIAVYNNKIYIINNLVKLNFEFTDRLLFNIK